MSKREVFLAILEKEYPTTLRVMKAYPEDKLDWTPHEKSKKARDLMLTIIGEEKSFVVGALQGKIDFTSIPQGVMTKGEMLDLYEKSHAEVVQKIKEASDDDFEKTMQFPVEPGKMGDVLVNNLCWLMIMDQIHHRGQFSVYLRMAGGLVPSIYGPSADEPWPM